MNAKRQKPYLGLSFHVDHVCMVEAFDDSIQTISSRELVHPFGLEALRDGNDAFGRQVEAVRDLVSRSSGRTRNTGVVLHSGMVLLKRVPVALGLEEQWIRDQMNWEAGQCLISPPELFTLDYQRLPFQTPEGNPVYLLVLLRRKIIDKIRYLIQECGLSLREVDVDVFSSLRTLLNNETLGSGETAVLVDVQSTCLNIVFIKENEYFLSHLSAIPPRSGIPQITDILLKDLRRLIFGHRLGQGLEDLQHIYLAGARPLEDLSEELKARISVPVDTLNPFHNMLVSPSVKASEDYATNPVRYAASLGLTVKHGLALKG